MPNRNEEFELNSCAYGDATPNSNSRKIRWAFCIFSTWTVQLTLCIAKQNTFFSVSIYSMHIELFIFSAVVSSRISVQSIGKTARASSHIALGRSGFLFSFLQLVVFYFFILECACLCVCVSLLSAPQ